MAKLVERDAERVIVHLYFLTLGKHVQADLPRIAGIHPGVEVHIALPLDGDPAHSVILC